MILRSSNIKYLLSVIIVFCFFTACNSANRSISEPTGKIIQYGNIDIQLLSNEEFKNNAYISTIGFDIEDKKLFILKGETYVPPLMDVVFGYKLSVANLPSGEVLLEKVLTYPETTDCVLGKDSVQKTTKKFNINKDGELNLIVAQSISELCEFNFGAWELTVLYQGHKLASMKFVTDL